MSFPRKVFSLPLADGRQIQLEFGRMAGLASGACTATLGETTVLATAMLGNERDIDFFPLNVNYEQKLFAAGIIKGSRFVKREGRPTDESILSQRVIDRGLRPLFPDGMRREVQVITTVLSFDGENDPDMVASVAASAALAVSEIPWDGPTGTVRVARDSSKKLLLNPTDKQRETSDLDLIVTSTAENVVMVEAGANEVPEAEMLAAIAEAKRSAQDLAREIAKVVAEIGKKKVSFEAKEFPAELVAFVREKAGVAIAAALRLPTKLEQNAALAAAKEPLAAEISVETHALFELSPKLGEAFDKVKKEIIRAGIVQSGVRPGGRDATTIRPLSAEVQSLPRVHGSAIFQRGETQNLAVLTLGAPGDAQILEDLRGEHEKFYIHHYSDLPFAYGDVSNRLMPGNRAIGHGALAERALLPVLPRHEDFPYTMRVVSNILACNGSSSMASVCGSSLALMDGGVPIKAPVAGVAMGLIADGGTYRVLTDIAGVEDACGDMDFKVAGTARGITALQLDTKTWGLPPEVFEKAFSQAHDARMQILAVMNEAISAPRAEMSQHAPRIISLTINPEQIGAVIGKGGETIRKIIAETGVETIDVEDSGLVFITSKNGEASDKAVAWIKQLTWNPSIGDIIEGPITKVADFGVFVEIAPGRDAMCHISRLTGDRLARVEDSGVKLGDVYKYQVVEIDEARGKISLSKVAVDGGKYENGATPHSGGAGGGFSGGSGFSDRGGDRGPRGGHGFGGDRGGRGSDRGGREGHHGSGFHGGQHQHTGGHDRAGHGFHEKEHRGDHHAHRGPAPQGERSDLDVIRDGEI